jgi:hypothetical protein|nr:MAG TPA: PhnA Zinc-Ribbon [Caudoviricetes sp.]
MEDVEMKCICGYEQDRPFEQYKNFVPSGMMRNIHTVEAHKNLYICPKCGTVKFEEVEHEVSE